MGVLYDEIDQHLVLDSIFIGTNHFLLLEKHNKLYIIIKCESTDTLFIFVYIINFFRFYSISLI